MAFKLDNIEKSNPKGNIGSDIDTLLKSEIHFLGSAFPTKKKYEFYNEIGVLLQAGVVLKDALQLVVENQRHATHRDIVEGILYKVINGSTFSKAIMESKHFTEYEFYSLEIGEETGTLGKVCQSLAVFFERKIEQRRIIVGALTYPVIVLTTSVIVVVFMLNFVVPMFEDIFSQNKVELPYLTKMVISISNVIKHYGLFVCLALVLLVIAFRFMMRDNDFKGIVHNLVFRTPVIGKFIAKVYLSQFTQAISLLTTSKIPMLNSIQLVIKMVSFIPLKKALQNVEDEILKGNSLSKGLSSNKIFDARIISLVKVAEETNQTDFVFNQLNEQYNNEVIQQSKLIATFIEPLIIVVVGLIVGLLLISLYLPMFKLSTVIG